MSTALIRRDGRQRDPAHASARCRKAAEHYVRNGCKFIGPSLIYAGYSRSTAKDPSANGYTHDWLLKVASYWNKGATATAKSHLAEAIKVMADLMYDPAAGAAARGSAAKVLIDYGMKEAEKEDPAKTATEDQAKWIAQIRHWKRVFLRRGIMLGMSAMTSYDPPFSASPIEGHRAVRLLAELNYMLGKGPRPEWMEDSDESVLGPEGDSRPGDYLEAEVVEEHDGTAPGAGSDPTDPE